MYHWICHEQYYNFVNMLILNMCYQENYLVTIIGEYEGEINLFNVKFKDYLKIL